MKHEDVQKLAELSRIRISDTDIPDYLNDFENILGYINTIQSLSFDNHDEVAPVLKNVVRPDTRAYTAGEFSDDILEQAPVTDNRFIRVQKIL